MKIAIVGAGGVGCYYGGRLMAGGHDVSFVARGANLEALCRSGLHIESALGDAHLTDVSATDHLEDVGPVDAVLLGVKAYDIEAVGKTLEPLLHADTAVLCAQNGVDAIDRLGPVVSTGHVLGAVVYGNTARIEPGRVKHLGTLARLRLGGRDARSQQRAVACAAVCEAAGIDAEAVDDIDSALWTKFVLFSVMSAACCLSERSTGELREDSDARAILQRGMDETAAVARAKGVRLDSDVVKRSLAIADTMAADSVPSMVIDLRAGRRLELESLSGTIVRLGRELDVDVPFHETAYAMLKHRAR
ncbi:MAG: 2-dehydropantoate 2-reductase [Vicinamibacterales bacterium]|nr:2-dehydropantoate 2-reductase [Vicinamibacterales bacterium]MDP6800047.1 2-dehydropantoate 2-reductase [SAR202 cluster bacterium]